ncbi:uncharacterized protein LOC6051285 [Culex quinquefasciatus]|uniref:uncharacterized protein LOC6051285 n=1 Tax=Culex quinquefasciatus TaxID=7176 RepID=UPI0018E36E75|nr:uncharacterized protein LOC6051285 [Culex quinquefasciatus]
MAVCSNCYKQIPNARNHSVTSSITPETIFSRISEDREMSRFLYRLTQEIVTSRNFSDSNINRICSKYYESASFPDKSKLGQVVTDLKRKLQVNPDGSDTPEKSSITLEQCVCSSSRRSSRSSKTTEDHVDKSISTQSFLRIPEVPPGVDSFTQMGDSRAASQLHVKPEEDAISKTSISTISSYNFPSSMYSELTTPERRRSSGTAGADSIIISEEIAGEEPVDGCRHRHPKDSSADMMLRMAASSRMNKDGEPGPSRKCPLHRCHQFERMSANSALSGGCGKGCGSDFPLPPFAEMDESESPTTTCCGRRRKKKTKVKIDTRCAKTKGKKKK